MERKIGFIGSGNMARAIIKGLINRYAGLKESIFINDSQRSKAEALSRDLEVKLASNNIDIVNKCEVIILAVKPHNYELVLQEINSYLQAEHLIISLGAGVTMESIQKYCDIPLKIIRTMPNLPVLVGEGMVAISCNERVEEEDLTFTQNLFNSIGKVEIIEESLMDMVPAVSGSSPAFVYMFIEALADGAVLQGMAREKAYKFAAQAVLGSAKMVLEAHKHPGELKDMVCSPAGTTIKAVYALERHGFRGTIIEAMNVCTAKTRQLAND